MVPSVCHSGAMELERHVTEVREALVVAAEAGGDEARALAGRLVAPLDAALRLTLLNALSAAADEITSELAPGSVELRLRHGEPNFVVTAAPEAGPPTAAQDVAPSVVPADADDGAMTRINLRLPETLKSRAEAAAGKEGLSLNAWLVRAASTALAHDSPVHATGGPRGQHYTGWVR